MKLLYVGAFLLLCAAPSRACEGGSACRYQPESDHVAFGTALVEMAEQQAGRGQFSGALMVRRDGVPVGEGAFGEASKRFGVDNTIHTKFNLGSANKFLTAIAICQLVEQGKLGFDQRVGEILPTYPNVDVRNRVSVHHLLTHTGGTGDHFTEEFLGSSRLGYRSFRDYVPLIAGNGVAFEPGSRMEYSNAGYFILGLIIEEVSGQSYYEYVREHITHPAGAMDTECFDSDIPVAGVAEGYVSAEWYDAEHRVIDHPVLEDADGSTKAWRSNVHLRPLKGGPAGGGYSTVVDMSRIADAFMSDELVSRETRELMTKRHVAMPESPGMHYGYGTMVITLPDERTMFGHTGDFPGVQSVFAIAPDKAGESYTTLVILANYARCADPLLMHAIGNLP